MHIHLSCTCIYSYLLNSIQIRAFFPGCLRIGKYGMHIYYHLADAGTLLEHIAGGTPDSSVLYRLKISQQFAFGKQVFQRFQLAV